MGERFEVSELDGVAVAELLELVEDGGGKLDVTMGGTERFVVMTAERYRALSDGYKREKERAAAEAERAEAAEAALAAGMLAGAAGGAAEVAGAAAGAVGAAVVGSVEVADERTAPVGISAPQAAGPVAQGATASAAAPAPEAALGEHAAPYKTAQLPNTPIDSDDYQRSMWQDAIVERMRKVIDAEAPVEKQRLFNTVRASFGIKRSGRDIQSHNEWLFNRKINAKQTEFAGSTFVWRADQDPQTYRTYRPTNEEANRQIAEYPYQELLAAILAALGSAEKLSYEGLVEATMRLLGYKRKTNRVREVIGAAIEQAGEDGVIRVFTDGTFRIA